MDTKMAAKNNANGVEYSSTGRDAISLEQYLTSLLRAQDEKTVQRLTAIEGRATESAGLVKDALTTAASSVKDALNTAATATEKATEKAEGVTTGKIEGVQSEMRIRLSALEAVVKANAEQNTAAMNALALTVT